MQRLVLLSDFHIAVQLFGGNVYILSVSIFSIFLKLRRLRRVQLIFLQLVAAKEIICLNHCLIKNLNVIVK